MFEYTFCVCVCVDCAFFIRVYVYTQLTRFFKFWYLGFSLWWRRGTGDGIHYIEIEIDCGGGWTERG